MRLPVVALSLVALASIAPAALAQDAPRSLVVPVPATAPSATTMPRVLVELPAMDRDGALEVYEVRRDRDGEDVGRWQRLCLSPCAISVPVGTRLRVNGDFRESAAFLAANQPTMRLAVHPVRSGVRNAGIALASTGGGLLLFSGLLFAGAPASEQENLDRGDPTIRVTRNDAILSGLFSAVVLGAGVGLAAWHWETKVSVVGSTTYGVPIARGVWWGPNGVRF